MSDPRYALYFTPNPDSALWRFGSSVVGYDSFRGEAVRQIVPDGIDPEEWRRITDDPRRYGFHATLKAPFYLAEGVEEDTLRDAVRRFARAATPVPLSPLFVRLIGPFLAVVPVETRSEHTAMASVIVRNFDVFRAPITDEDRARRLKSPLTEPQTCYLDQFGYPYVHEEFKFHLTLTGPLHIDLRTPLLNAMTARFADEVADEPCVLDAISLVKQDDRSAQFRVLDHVRFG